MLIFALDDEPLMLDELETCIREALPGADVRAFSRSAAALEAMRAEALKPDAVFSDIEMPEISGMELARRIKALSPRSNIVFVTGYAQYALEALRQHASGFVMKPVTPEKIRAEMAELRYPAAQRERRIRVQCFGNFAAFADGRPLRFGYAKTRELFAYLVDRRGSAADMAELCAVLWEDKPDSPALRSQLRNLTADLRKTLEAAGAETVLLKQRNSVAVDVNAFDCDYYRFLEGEAAALNAFDGEYMQQYPWAEARLGALLRR